MIDLTWLLKMCPSQSMFTKLLVESNSLSGLDLSANLRLNFSLVSPNLWPIFLN